MSPAADLRFLDRGTVKWFSQRVTAPPMTDCMFAALCTPLTFMGYDLPETFIRDLRRASGVPESLPTSTPASKTALRALIPDCPINFGGLDDEEMLERLEAGEISVRVMVRAGLLPKRLRRFFSSSFTAGHAVALGGARRVNGKFEVLYMDPAGRPRSTYQARFEPYEDIRPALMRTPKGRVRATWGERNAALPDRPDEGELESRGIFRGSPFTRPDDDQGAVVLSRARFDEFARIPKGTPFLHPVTREQVTRASAAGDFRLAGRSSDGRLSGVWVNTRRVKGARGMTLLLVDREQIGPPFVRPEP